MSGYSDQNDMWPTLHELKHPRWVHTASLYPRLKKRKKKKRFSSKSWKIHIWLGILIEEFSIMKNHQSDFRLHPFEFRFFSTRRFFLAQLPTLTLICTDIAKILPKETYKCASQHPLSCRAHLLSQKCGTSLWGPLFEDLNHSSWSH